MSQKKNPHEDLWQKTIPAINQFLVAGSLTFTIVNLDMLLNLQF